MFDPFVARGVLSYPSLAPRDNVIAPSTAAPTEGSAPLQMDLDRIREWLYSEALPLWAETGIDGTYGGFCEGLDLEGRPMTGAAKRLRVQARQIYVYSHAAVLGWDGPALETAGAGYEFMTRHYWHADGGWIFSADRAGNPLDRRRDAYEQAFALLALAWYYRASGEEAALAWVARTLDFLDQRLGDPVHGGYREYVPETPSKRRQNPHMHLFEAVLALNEATGEDAYLDRARSLLDLLDARFVDRETGTLGEFFTEDWSPAPGIEGRQREPGHHYEWVWLLGQYRRIGGEDGTRARAAGLYQFAENAGTDPADGLAFDMVLDDGTVFAETKRLWPQTEALKAQLVESESGGRPGAWGRAEALLTAIFARYLSLGPGIWHDQLGAGGTAIADHVPASTFYHLFVAFSECLRLGRDQH